MTRTLTLAPLALVLACSGAPAVGYDAGPSADSGAPQGDASGGDAQPTSSCPANPYGTADLYVSPTGADGASGTEADPTTLAGVASKIQALQSGRTTPIVVFLEDGTYAPWTLSVSGTAQAPVVFTAAPNAKPVVSGGRAITGWTKTTVNGVAAWRASGAGLVPFSHLYVDGVRRDRPRTTPNGYLYNANTTTTYTTLAYAGNDVSAFYDMPHVEVAAFENWTLARMHIASIDTSQKLVTFTGSTNTSFYHGVMPSHRYLLDNVKEALAKPGQFYFDQPASAVLYVPASASEDPNAEVVVAPQAQTLLDAKNVSNVTLRGITFAYGNWTVPQQGWRDSQTESDSTANLPAAVSFDGAANVTIDACTVQHVSAIGLEIVGSGGNNHVVRSLVTDTGGSGMRIGAWPTPSDTDANVQQHDVVEENVVSGVGRFFPSGNGIFVGNAHDITVRHNDVFDTYTYAIDVGATYGNHPDNYVNDGLAHDNVIELNHVYQVGQGVTSDIGGIYTAMGTQTGNVVQNNVVHDVTHDPGNPSANIPEGYGGWGLYNDASSSNITWQNNLAYRCSQAAFHFNYGKNATIRNNVFAFGSEAVVEFSNPESHLSFTFDGNIVYSDNAALWQRGDWMCPLGALTKCVVATNNLYVSASATPVFTQKAVQKLGSQQNWPSISFAQWQGLGEDPAPSTVMVATMFGSEQSPTFDLGGSFPTPFKPFDPSAAGRTCTALQPAGAPAGFPIQPWPAAF